MFDALADLRLSMVVQQVYEQQAKALEERSQQNAHVDQLMGEVSSFEEDDSDGLEPES